MGELCAYLDELEAQSNTEVRVATELLIDTGRRPDEINTLLIWRESGVGAPADFEELQRTISRLEQQTVDLTASLEEREAELEAARAADRELIRALDQKGAADRKVWPARSSSFRSSSPWPRKARCGGASRFDRCREETDAAATDLAQPERQQILG
jgi:hypothetical protein